MMVYYRKIDETSLCQPEGYCQGGGKSLSDLIMPGDANIPTQTQTSNLGQAMIAGRGKKVHDARSIFAFYGSMLQKGIH